MSIEKAVLDAAAGALRAAHRRGFNEARERADYLEAAIAASPNIPEIIRSAHIAGMKEAQEIVDQMTGRVDVFRAIDSRISELEGDKGK